MNKKINVLKIHSMNELTTILLIPRTQMINFAYENDTI